MAGTWAAARARIAVILDGRSISSPYTEELNCYEYPPPAPQTELIPYAYIIPASRTVRRMPTSWRETTVEARVRVLLAGKDGVSAEDLAQRYDAWVDNLITAFDTALALDGNADIIGDQTIDGLQFFDLDQLWGFECGLGAVRISEAITPGA